MNNEIRTSIFIFSLGFLLGLFSLSISSAHAEDCDVSLRVMRGQKSSGDTRVQEIPKMLDDISGALKAVPYKNFNVLDTQKTRVRFESSATFMIPGADGEKQSVTIVPHKFVGKRVKTTVNWFNNAGDEILSTKLRIINSENMVVGTDHQGGRSTLVCVSINCVTK